MFSTSSKADATFLKSVGRPIVNFDGRIGLRSLDRLEWLPDRLRFQSARRHGRFAHMTDEQASSPDHMTIPMSAPSSCQLCNLQFSKQDLLTVKVLCPICLQIAMSQVLDRVRKARDRGYNTTAA